MSKDPGHSNAIERKSLVALSDKIGAVPPQLAGLLGEISQQPAASMPLARRDLRRGTLWLSAGIGFAVFCFSGMAMSQMPTKSALLAMGTGAFPAAIGIGYLVLGFIASRSNS